MPYVRRPTGVQRFRGGMGLYPNQPCFDPTRPSWLPYWWDTNSENLCKFGVYPSVSTLAPVPPPPPAAPPGAPQTQEQMTVPGAFTPEQAATESATQSTQGWQNFFNQLASGGAFGGPGATPGQCDATQQSWLDWTTWCPTRWLAVAGFGALGAVVLFAGARR
jgi:hypothetical protein